MLVKAAAHSRFPGGVVAHRGLATETRSFADLLRQSGVIRTDTLEELFDVATLLAISLFLRAEGGHCHDAGGPGILAAMLARPTA